MKKKKIIILSVIIALVLIAGLVIYFKTASKTYVVNTKTVEKGEVELTITATGYVQPVDQVEVGTQVSGVVEKIYVDYNSQVTKGQLLAELDKLTLKEKVTQAEASLRSSQSALTNAQLTYDRTKKLFDKKAATQTSLEDTENQLTQAQSSVDNAKANLYQAKVNLGYAEIYSPIDGVVLDRAVEEGQTVAASFNTPTLFTIANDLKNMQVEADVDEADIGQVKLGQKVTFSVDAFPDYVFEGSVNQIRLQPVVTSNVVTYTVIIAAPNPDEKLYPGMTASITIITDHQEDFIVSNEALNFQPTEDFFREKKIAPPAEMPKKAPGAVKGVWIETPDAINFAPLETGISDGVNTIVKSGVKQGDQIVVSASYQKTKSKGGEAASNPLMPQPRRR